MIVYALILTFNGHVFNHPYNFATEEYCRHAGRIMVKEGVSKFECKRRKV